MTHALRQGVVIEWLGEILDRPVDAQHFVDCALVVDELRPHDADVKRRDLAVLEPSVAEEVAAT